MTVKRLYDDNMYRFGEAQPSFWEATAGLDEPAAKPLDGEQSCDVAIIGGGYTGLSAALHLARDYQLDVRVLDAGHIGWGASGRNGGFCSMGGSALDLDVQLKQFGVDNVRHYYQGQVDAVRLVAELLQDHKIDANSQGDCELEVAHSPAAFKDLKSHAEKQLQLLGINTAAFTADEFREQFFDSTEQHGAISIRPTFGLHPLRYLKGLAVAAEKVGATLHASSEVTRWEKDDRGHKLSTANGSLRARQVVMATNGFMPEHLRQEFYGVPLPMISAIIVTRPLTDDELAAHCWVTENPTINSRELMNYFRMLPDKRFMFGGRGHSTGTPEGTLLVRDSLKRQLNRQWPEWSGVDVDYFWHGLICMTRRLTPCIGRLESDPSIFYGFGYHGNGVNTSTWTGKQIADWLGQSASDDESVPESLPQMVRGLSPSFPMPALRLKYLKAALTWKRFQDWRN